LTGLSFIAQSGGDIGYCSNRGIVEAALKSNRAERRKTVCYPDPEAKVVTEIAPFLNHSPDFSAHIKRHQNGLERRVFHWHRIIENDHNAISKSLKRATVFDDDLTDCRMIVAQQGHYIFRVSTFREASKSA
jgi:hypothetical protein